MNFFIFDGKNSLDFGIRIENYPAVSYPQRVIETYQIPGRSGDLVFDTGAYGNASQTYSCWYKAPKEFSSYDLLDQIGKWLLSHTGYKRLEDSCFPDVYRMAVYSGPAEISSFFAKYGRAELEFTCMPQKWLKSGEIQIEVANGQQFINPGEPALPLIAITGSGAGSIGIGESSIDFSDIPEEGLVIDCENQNIYSGTQNKNALATVSGGFPKFPKGKSGVAFSGGVQTMAITPRWWIL